MIRNSSHRKHDRGTLICLAISGLICGPVIVAGAALALSSNAPADASAMAWTACMVIVGLIGAACFVGAAAAGLEVIR